MKVQVNTLSGNPKSVYIEPRLKDMLDLMSIRLKKKRDALILVDGNEGEGKCLSKGSKVLMSNGKWKNIEDVKEGDVIISPQTNGKNIFSKVIKTSNWFCKDAYDVINLNKNQTKLYTCSGNHLIPINIKVHSREKLTEEENKLNRKEKFEILKNKKRFKGHWIIKNYQAKDYAILSKSLKTNSSSLSSYPIKEFEGRDNCNIEPYSLGVFLGDGHFSSQGCLGITSNDFKLLERISKCYPVMAIDKNKESKVYRFSINGEFAQQLIKYGLKGKGSRDKFIPEDAMLSNLDYRIKLLEGLIDTDGYYSHGGYQFTLKSKQLIQDIKNLVYSIGGRTGEIRTVKKSIKSRNFTGTYYALAIYLGNMKLNLCKEYKIKNDNSFYVTPNRTSIDVIKSKPCQVYGIEIDSKSKLYITDNWMITHNSNMASLIGAYMGEILKRPYTVENIFFDIDKMLDFAVNTKEQIIHWDEGALGGLASEWWNKNQIKFIKLLMVARKKKHFFIICIPKFYKLTEYIACDRSLGLVHVYSADNLEQGRFTYYNAMSKEKLYDNWKRKHLKTFRTGYNFHGRFLETLPVVVDEESYEKKKDEAILSMGKEERSHLQEKMKELKIKIVTRLGFSAREISEKLDIPISTVKDWFKYARNDKKQPIEYPPIEVFSKRIKPKLMED